MNSLSSRQRLLLEAALLLALVAGVSALAEQAKPAPKKTGPATDPAKVALAAAQGAIERQDYPAAATILENLLFEQPGHPEALFQLAYCYSLQGRTADAIDLYRQTLEAYPKLVPARINLGLLLLDSNQPEAAAAEFSRVLDAEPGHARAHLLLASALERTDKKDEAAIHYRRAAELDPALAESRRSLLERLLQESRWSEAQAEVEALIREEPEDASLLRLRAELLLRQEKEQDALAAYEDYLKAKPNDAQAHLEAGRLSRRQGKREEALQHFQAAGATPESLLERADTLLSLERWEEAIPVYRQALEGAPRDAELRAGLGYALFRSKRYAEAVPELSEALRLDPKRVETYNHLAGALALSGNPAGAIQVLDARAAHAEETPGTLFLRAQSYDKLRQCGPAIDFYEKFLALNRDTASDQYFQATGRLRLLKNVCRERRR